MKRFELLLAVLLFPVSVSSFLSCKEVKKETAKPPLWEDIQEFKKQDLASMPPAGAILFIGSSSFTLWSDVQQYFPDHTIINRGFGSSTLADQIRYVNDIVFPYKPKQIIVYCGENDLAFSDTVNAQIVADRFKTWFGLVREKLPDIPMVYISMKPSPSRRALIPEFRKGNDLIREFISKQKNIVYLDVHSQMLDEQGQPRGELFIYDSLHMNAKGYELWKKNIEPLLLKN
jgi:lysophospholipase L1-like esterase